MSKADNFKQIYGWEKALTDAWERILRDHCGLAPFAQGDNLDLTPGGQETIATGGSGTESTGQPVSPRAETVVESGGAKQVNGVAGNFYTVAWNFTLQTTIVTVRGKTSGLHLDHVALVRLESQLFRDRFTESLLPYHLVVWMEEQGATRSSEPTDDEDRTTMRFAGVINLRAGSWPTPAI